ncbi:Glucose dehydrogenase [FAD, quinone] [Cryptotermes secundus]|uniref:Glucose dehydrogenase [FAD, quinone] n=1 Tax=Cryptotermes secundus TaxID=105785 RepID=A0A2J7PET3_9NEOP|nr:glucose dehydrogenase [FAD, quinone] [Cryptotermes secundus]XP_033611341.1 glucose dehydrogenase [FAD, quinone] [Cryptotermes secundus]XP_033611342.1 glucose dehydrogenase [FAD, quinone] [Cryptotermes secundus]PNF14838.1 Glucose dehydrogenase [FAD, quinone] [Cryptotermes secundus]
MVSVACPATVLLCYLAWHLPKLIDQQQEIGSLFPPFRIFDGERYDFIIVGGGSAGCVVASRLSEISDWKVLLLEAGGEEPPQVDVPAYTPFSWETSVDWQFQTEPHEGYCGGKSCTWNAGKVLGGGSVLNGMIYNRGNARSYDAWKKLGNDGWGFEDVLPYFKKSENNGDPPIAANSRYHAVGGLLNVQRLPYQDKNAQLIVEAFRELGYTSVDINGGTQTGVTLLQFTQKDGSRMSTNRAFIEPFRGDRKNLKVVTNVRVTKVLIDPNKKTAYGVEYAWEKHRHIRGKVYANKEVIVSSGALKSPQVLMLSGIGPRSILSAAGIDVIEDLQVGQNLQDHVSMPGIVFKLGEKQQTLSSNQKVLRDILEYARHHKGPLSGTGSLEASGYIKSRYADPAIDYPDIQYFIPPQTVFNTSSRDVRITTPFSEYNRLMFQPGVMSEKSVGYITIKKKDPFLQPIIFPNYFANIEDLNVFIDGCNFVAKNLSNTKVFKDVGVSLDTTPLPKCAHVEFGTNDYWACLARNYTLTLHHFSGTCKMGPDSDPTAVLDAQLRVRGVQHLRVIDASIIPTLGNSNTNAPVIMIAEKASDMIKEAWK